MISTISGLFLIDAGYVIFSGEATDEDLGVTLFRLGGLFVGVLLLLLPLEVLVSKKISSPKLQNKGTLMTLQCLLIIARVMTSHIRFFNQQLAPNKLIFLFTARGFNVEPYLKKLDLMSFVAPTLSEKYVM